eukprot:GHUV01016952.1.p1 GENE.GHUV01016952.1~~GHUV01016952.1.p1  ORF type:complete len:762 (+),score=276.11 GHUV01016952.1:6674-8959(+)
MIAYRHVKSALLMRRLLQGHLFAAVGLIAAAGRHGQIRSYRLMTYTQKPLQKHDPYRTPPKNYVQLLQHITRARKVDKLNSLVRQYHLKFDAVHVAAAMSVLPKLYEPMQSAKGLRPSKIREKREVPQRLLEQLQRLANEQVPRMFAREMASVTWSLGRLRNLLPQHGRDTATRELLNSMVKRISKDNSRLLYQGATGAEIAKLLHGMARLGYGNNATVNRLCRFIRNQPGRFHAKELAAVAWALERLKCKGADAAAALDAISSKAVELRLYMRPAHMCSLLTAAARMHRRDEQLLSVITEEAQEQLDSFKPGQLAVLVWALGRLQCTPKAELLAAVNSRSKARLEQFSSKELGMLLKGLSQLNSLDKQLLADIAAGLSKEEAVALSCRDAARILAAYVKVPDAGTVRDVDGMARRIGAAIHRKTHSVKPYIIANLLLCYSKLGCHAPVVFGLLMAATEDTANLTISHWLSLLQSCKRLGFADAAVSDSAVVDFYQAADKALQQHLLGAAAPATVAAVQAADVAPAQSLSDAEKGATGQQQPRKSSGRDGLWQRLTGSLQQQKPQDQAAEEPRQPKQHTLHFGPAVEVALLLNERAALGPGRPALSQNSVVYLADVGAKTMPDMTLRQIMMLLTAVLSADRYATLEEVRQLLVAAGKKLQAELQGQEESQVPWPVLVALTRPLSRAISKGMLAKQGVHLMQTVYEQMMDHVDQCTEKQLQALCDSMGIADVYHDALLARAEAIASERGFRLPKPNEWQAFR